MSENITVSIEVLVNASIKKVWDCMNNSDHIVHWNFAIPEWHCPAAENDLRVGGKLKSRMEARDGSMGFDFEGEYTLVEELKTIHYTIADGRRVEIHFESIENTTKVTEIFEPENQNPIEMQQAGWQMILNNFKNYVESLV